ncbi:DUF2059 domain-containing protein [Colwellia sp. BRX10-6]|uniref:DUF2059 domain-containing protein n=1 Tax=unclassified Colwellia TaxID=196834 RepID=UPI0015F65BBE|nr:MULTISPECIES: DUF2059 domain-containing protein [unclassified Colwellia]MBA6382650.1 DUF2059 domain-containing protein [Colwellia sp. BRX10-9]MBA6392873.1 DUF2059 domain-containing protein [Colwellia sp. BRX10-6]
MRRITMLLLVLMLSFTSKANDLSSRASIEKLMELTEVSKMIESMQSQVTLMFEGMSKKMNISNKEKVHFDKYMDKVNALLDEKMNWHSFKEPMIDIYSRNFTEAEIQGLITFYRSDIGRSMTKKMPLIIQDSIILSQQLMQDFIPEVKSLAKELSASIEQSRQKEQTNK